MKRGRFKLLRLLLIIIPIILGVIGYGVYRFSLRGDKIDVYEKLVVYKLSFMFSAGLVELLVSDKDTMGNKYEELINALQQESTIRYLNEKCKEGGDDYCAMIILSVATSKNIQDISPEILKGALVKVEGMCERGDPAGCIIAGRWYEKAKNNVEVEKFYERACGLGSHLGCYYVGILNLEGGNIDKGVSYLDKACNMGEGEACSKSGGLYFEGKVVNKELRKAAKYYLMSCEDGYIDMCDRAIKLYFENSPDAKETEDALMKMCKMGSDKGCLFLGYMYEKQNKLDEARRVYTRACTLGCVPQCSLRGTLRTRMINKEFSGCSDEELKMKLGVAGECDWLDKCKEAKEGFKSFEDGIRHFEKFVLSIYEERCEKGELNRCYSVADIYRNMNDERAKRKALQLFKRLCEMHKGEYSTRGDIFSSACEEMVKMFKSLSLSQRERNEELIHLEMLCDTGMARACGVAGMWYEKGLVGKRDYMRAREFYEKAYRMGDKSIVSRIIYRIMNFYIHRKLTLSPSDYRACDENNDYMCELLGILYIEGIGVKKDVEKGKEFLSKVCGSEWGCYVKKGIGYLKNSYNLDVSEETRRIAGLYFLKEACDREDAEESVRIIACKMLEEQK